MDPNSTPTPTTAASGGIEYAGFLQRAIASIIDGILLGIVNSVLTLLMGKGIGGSFLASLLSLVIFIFYYVYFIGKSGQTLGKKILNIKVVQEKDNTKPPTYMGAFLREIIGKFLSSFVLLLGYFWMIWDKKKQTWHDKIASTIVIKV